MKKFFFLLFVSLFVFTSCNKEDEIIDLTADKKLSKITICHYDADTDTWHTIIISENELKAHLAHGDYIGACNENEKTYVPDDNFENYLEAHDQYDEIVEVGALDSMGDGIANNDYVFTANISEVISLSITIKAITDLTGIEDFISLISLHCGGNSLETLDLSQNIALADLSYELNQLTSLDI